jgi:serine/threonine protein kinase
MGNRIGEKILGPNGEKFIIEARLGEGGFGEVYRAVGEISKQIVALKMIPSNKLSDPSTLSFRALFNEIKHALLEIRHPNVISYLYVDDGTQESIGPYVMLEYVEDGTLLDLLQELRSKNELIPLEDAVSLMRQIALGVEAINEQVIHRDIKPDNILLVGRKENPTPKIADFGISKFALDETRLETFKGIQHFFYISPEVIKREKNTYKIDTYSVGLVFYEILSLQHPLLIQISNPNDLFEWQDAHLHLLPPDIRTLRADVPLHLSKLLLQMTDKLPSNRPNWQEVLASINYEQPTLKPIAPIDSSLISIMQKHVEDKFKEEQQKKAQELEDQKRVERWKLINAEIKNHRNKLLEKFDAIIEELNIQVPDYLIEILKEENGRLYRLPNNKTIDCSITQLNWIEGMYGEHKTVQLVGFIGCSGGFSANLILAGNREDISNAAWQAIGATVSGIISGEARIKAYKDAGVDDKTIRYAEYLDGNAFWRRDAPGYFGFHNFGAFIESFSSSGMGRYNFEYLDLMQTFNDVIKVSMQMP